MSTPIIAGPTRRPSRVIPLRSRRAAGRSAEPTTSGDGGNNTTAVPLESIVVEWTEDGWSPQSARTREVQRVTGRELAAIIARDRAASGALGSYGDGNPLDTLAMHANPLLKVITATCAEDPSVIDLNPEEAYTFAVLLEVLHDRYNPNLQIDGATVRIPGAAVRATS